MRPHLLALAALFAPVGLLWALLRGPISAVAVSPWGPEDPWRNGDLIGGWWLWWAFAEERAGRAAMGGLAYPDGVEALLGVVPNPLDVWLLSGLGPPTALLWNLNQLGQTSLNLVAAGILARAAGASPLAAAAACALLAASPTMLHELAGGRPATLIVWPGLLSLALLLRGGLRAGALAGLFAALQGVAYAWHGLALCLIGLPLARDRRALALGVLVGALAITPYAVTLAEHLRALPIDRPAAGYTSAPIAGLFGLGDVPPRVRLHPLLLVGAIVSASAGAWRFALAATIALLIALGPGLTWAYGEPVMSGPFAWLTYWVEPLRRMHHPARLLSFAGPLLAVCLALGLDRLGRLKPLALALTVLAAGLNHQAMREVVAWGASPTPPYADRALPEGPAVDVHGMTHRVALSLQPFHRRPLMEPLWFRRPTEDKVAQEVDRLARGERPAPWLWDALRARGLKTVIVWPRFGEPDDAARLVEEALGPPVQDGVWAL
ncbi:MAG: hypothetical protein IPO67_14460 [Deltaproteobacteria bacterium]|nr:hypothetical protein [Deltaproteobacteria bacterium]